MFPQSLQKNIRELSRQISLLETECEHIEADKKEILLSDASHFKPTPNKPFITGPASSYSSRMLIPSSVAPKIYSASCVHFRTISEKLSNANDAKGTKDSQCSNSACLNDSKPCKKTENSCKETREDMSVEDAPDNKKVNGNSGEKTEEKSKSAASVTETRKLCERSISSIREVSESSEENVAVCNSKSKKTRNEQTWCELLSAKNPADKEQGRSKNKTPRAKGRAPALVFQNFSKSKPSSDEESNKERRAEEAEIKLLGKHWAGEYDLPVAPRKKIPSKRRPRSARTRKNYADEIPLDLNIAKTLQEKEIQCMLWSEDKEKAGFLGNLNESIRILHVLIDELMKKSSRETRNEVLNDMQNTLMKMNKIKSMNTIYNPLSMLTCLKGNSPELLEGEENTLDLKKTLIGVKRLCQELTDEKSALTEELCGKNRALSCFKNKEKEYLSLISNLKFNLEKMKEEAEEGARAKRDLKLLKVKLQEEAKVIEALKKSHEKMQDLVENYALENDKLKAQVKINKLETQKFNVLLAGKEAEINKYKKEIESFQRQITEQLSLLRSKAAESEVEGAIEAISNQTHIYQTELYSDPSEMIIEKDSNEGSALALIKTSSDSSSTKTQPDNQTKGSSSTITALDVQSKKGLDAESTKLFNSGHELHRAERNIQDIRQDADRTTKGEANNSDREVSSGRQYGLQRVLSSSKNLRSSINELLEDIKRETSEKSQPDLPNFCDTSSQSTLILTSSEDASQDSQKD